MHLLKTLTISNFRSCKYISIDLHNYTPLVGYNNAGKSTIIKAIIWLLSPSGAITENDYFCNDTSVPIEVSGELTGISEEILNKIGATHQAKILPYITDASTLTIKRVQPAPGGNKADRPLYVLKPAAIQSEPESWDKNPAGIDAAISALFPSPIHIQAMQDANEDVAKNTSSSTLGKLLKEILGIVEYSHSKDISDAVQKLADLLSVDGLHRAPELEKIDSAANAALCEFFPGIQIRSEIPSPSIQTLFKSGTIKVKDPNRSDDWFEFESVGHGAQRTIQMALVRCLSERIVDTSDPACRLLLIDEPELYLHPQAIEQVRSSLASLSNVGYQVIFSTHSPIMVSKRDVAQTILVQKHNSSTKVLPTISTAIKSIVDDIDYNSQVELLFTLSNSSQILFSESVLFVEGTTELRVIPHLYESHFGSTLASDKIALVELRGCANTRKIIDIMKTLGIRYKFILDLDALFTHRQALKFFSDDDEDISHCLEYFRTRQEAGELALNDFGLPKRSSFGINASCAFANCAADVSCKPHVLNLHENAKSNFNVWVWPCGDIEHALKLPGKDEGAWASFQSHIEREGIASQAHDPILIGEFFTWLRS